MHGRRDFFIGSAALVAAACTQDAEESVVAAPWLMWGSEQTTALSVPIGAGTQLAGQQLTQIMYARPESWTFFFFAKIDSYIPVAASPVSRLLQVKFDLSFGIGRSTVVVPNFWELVWQLGTGGPDFNVVRYATKVRAPLTFAADTLTTLIEDLPAQNIQVNSRIIAPLDANEYSLNVTCASLWAPKTHVRPEWMAWGQESDSARFRGGEQGGL